MGGRQKQPVALLLAKGKTHLTKEEIEERERSEPEAPADRIEPPAFLTADEKKRFLEIADELLALGIIANLDAEALARYVTAETMYERLTRAVRRCYVTNIDELSKLLTAQDKVFKQCRAAASDLGLTITSRCRIVVPKPEEKPVNPFVSKFNPPAEDEEEAEGVG